MLNSFFYLSRLPISSYIYIYIYIYTIYVYNISRLPISSYTYIYSFIKLLFPPYNNNPLKLCNQIFYLIKWNQQKHLILECLLPNPINHQHKEKVWWLKCCNKGIYFWLILKHCSRGSNISFIKLGQCSKEWQFVSTSNPQQQIALGESRKPYLNLL